MTTVKASDVERAAVIGGGTMGHGIAQVLAMCGVEARLYDVEPDAARKALEKVRANLDKGVEKGKVEPSVREQALDRMRGTSDLAEATDGVQVVIEAVPERIELKRGLFEDLSPRLGPEVLLATNTSSLPVSKIAEAARHPERVTGMHFFNPVHIMKLVEVVRAERSGDDAVETSVELARRMGKEPIVVTDSPGFASSRLGVAIGLEAMRMLEAGVATAEDVDKAMTLGYGFPMGPLRLSDLVGLDTRLSIAEHLERELGERFRPPAVLREKVERGELGRKSGQGFYTWDA